MSREDAYQTFLDGLHMALEKQLNGNGIPLQNFVLELTSLSGENLNPCDYPHGLHFDVLPPFFDQR